MQRILGHGSITTTQRYSHLAPDEYGRVLDALDVRQTFGKSVDNEAL